MWDWPEDPRPPSAPTRAGDVVGLAAGMAAAELVLGGAWALVRGGLGLLPLLGGMVLGAALVLTLRVRADRSWLTRARLKQLAGGGAAAHVVLGGLAWALAGAPPELSAGATALGGLAVGLLVGGAALVVVLCVGDVVAMVLAPFPERPREQRWRRR